MLVGERFVTSGRTIFCPEEIKEDIKLKTVFEENNYTIYINANTLVFFSDKMLKTAKNEDNNVMMTVINCILNQAFREIGGFTQIGRNAKFFDKDHGRSFVDGLISAHPGYKAAAFTH